MHYHIGIVVIYLNKKLFSVEITQFGIDWMKNSFVGNWNGGQIVF